MGRCQGVEDILWEWVLLERQELERKYDYEKQRRVQVSISDGKNEFVLIGRQSILTCVSDGLLEVFEQVLEFYQKVDFIYLNCGKL